MSSHVINEDLARGLPLPLAQLYRRAFNEKMAKDRCLTAYYLWEASLKLLGSVAVVEYAERSEHDPNLVERLTNLARPSTGHWWEMARLLVPLLGQAGDLSYRKLDQFLLSGEARADLPRVAGLDSILREELENRPGSRSTVKILDLFDRLIQFRNKEMGHGAVGQRSGPFYQRLEWALLEGVAELLGRIDLLAGRRLIYIAGVHRLKTGSWLIDRFEMRGENPRRLPSLEVPEGEAKDLPRPERVYLEMFAQAGDSGMADPTVAPQFRRSLHPLVIFKQESGETFFLNGRRGKKRAEYLCYTTGNVHQQEELIDEQRHLMARILNLHVDPGQVQQWASQAEKEEQGAPAVVTEEEADNQRIGEFELLSELGRGGMGVVYRAWQPSLSRPVALKSLLQSGDARAEERFAREIRALGAVDHPHLIKIFTSGTDGDRWFYAMELIEGATLEDVRKKLASSMTGAGHLKLEAWKETLKTVCSQARQAERPISSATSAGGTSTASTVNSNANVPVHQRHAAVEAEALEVPNFPAGESYVRHMVRLVRQVAEAAHSLHQAGILHRDIKPGNIMVTRDGSQAVLMDLGLAQFLDKGETHLTKTRQFLGTLRYASPEQLMAVDKLDARADVYSLGASLWELVTLRPMFGATDQTPSPELIRKIQFEDPEPLRRLVPRASPDLEAVLQKCLEKDPSQRYASAFELADDLRRFLEGRPVKPRPIGKVERFWRWCKRKPAIATLTALLMLTFLGGFVGVWWQWLDAIKERDQKQFALNELQSTHDQLKTETEQRQQTLIKLERETEERQKTLTKLELEKGEKIKTLKKLQAVTYRGFIPLTQQEWRNGQTEKWEEFLNGCLPELRGWEWDYCKRLGLNWTFTLGRHSRPVWGVAYSPDGKWLAASDESGDIIVRNSITGEMLHHLKEPKGYFIYGLAFSPDSQVLASVHTSGAVKLWDVATGKEKSKFITTLGRNYHLAFHADGNLLAVLGDKGVVVRDLKNNKDLFTRKGQGYFYSSLTFIPESKWLATCLDGFVQVFDIPNGNEIFRDRENIRFRAVASSPDGQYVAASTFEGNIYVWNVKFWEVVQNINTQTNFIVGLTFSPLQNKNSTGGNNLPAWILATSSWDRTVKTWDMASGKLLDSFPGHKGMVTRLAYSPDGRFLASGSGNDKSGEVRVWEVEQKNSYRHLSNGELLRTLLAFHPDGRTLVAASEDLLLWDLLSGSCFRKLFSPSRRPFNSAAFSPDGKYLAAATTQEIVIWNVASWREERLIPTAGQKNNILAFHPQQPLLAVGSEDGPIRLWDYMQGKEQTTLPGHKKIVRALAFTPDGQWLASGADDLRVIIWDLAEKKPFLNLVGPQDSVYELAFHPQGHMLAASGGKVNDRGEILLWSDWQSPKPPPARRLEGHFGWVVSVAFTPDGQRLISSGVDRTVRVWMVDSGEEIMNFPMPASSNIGALNSDGCKFAAVAKDHKIHLWDATPTGEVFTFHAARQNFHAVGFHPDQPRLAAAGSAGKLTWWDTRTGEFLKDYEHGQKVTSIHIQPQGQFLASASEKNLTLWDLNSDTIHQTFEHPQRVNFVQFHPAGQIVASACTDKKIRLWDLETSLESQVFTTSADYTFSLAFQPKGNLLAAGSDDKLIHLWDITTGSELAPLKGHQKAVHEVTFHPDGAHLASASADKSIKIWDAKTGKEVRTLWGHFNKVFSLTFAASGEYLISCDEGGLLKVWDFATGRELYTLRGHTGSVSHLACQAHGLLLASAAQDESVRLWSLDFLRQPTSPKVIDFDQARWDLWYQEKIEEAKKRKNMEVEATLLGRLINRNPSPGPLLDQRGNLWVQLGFYTLAAADFARICSTLPHENAAVARYQALCYLQEKDIPSYQELCRNLLKAAPFTTDSNRLERIAWICSLHPAGCESASQLVDVATRAHAKNPQQNIHLCTLALALFRAGKHEESLQRIHEAIKIHNNNGTSWDIIVKAMNLTKTGDFTEAQSIHDRVATQLKTVLASPIRAPEWTWDQILELDLIRAELEKMLTKK